MTRFLKTLESKVRINYHDCHPFNHLNNARYIDYIVSARTEQLLENYGFNTAEIAQKECIGWVTVLTQISYLFPAIWVEKVIIETRLISFSESSLMEEAFMWNENKTKMYAIMWAKLVHFNIGTQKSLKHSEEYMELFRNVDFPIDGKPTFEERVKSVRP